MSDTLNIFALGNVLDPHIRIEGKCRICKGNGRNPDLTRCDECQGTGEATALVRLAEILGTFYGAEFVGTSDQVFPDGKE